jgi:hypothetical protein
MTDAVALITIAGAAFAGTSVIAWSALAGWRGWLDLQRQILDTRRTDMGSAPSAGSRIELADLRERVRKLEAIAAGVDL